MQPFSWQEFYHEEHEGREGESKAFSLLYLYVSNRDPLFDLFKVLSLSATKKVPKEKAPHDLPAKAGALRVSPRSGSPDGPSMARLSRGRLLPAILTDHSSLTFDARLRRKGIIRAVQSGSPPCQAPLSNCHRVGTVRCPS